jgi:DNA-binding MarR family transcriptional regulator/aminoglycoside phosphotransferase (APT) family kinase protein
MSARFTLRDLPGPPPQVEKRGPAAALAREAAALRLVAGRPWAPQLVAHEPGLLVSTRCPGAPRPLAALDASDARRLGALLREAHEVRRASEGGLDHWPAPARSLADYRARRAEDTEAALAGTAHAGLARRALGASLPERAGARPFRLLHGDLVEANVVWGPDGPALVDWEFWRMGDPAEDIAYLAEVNRLPPAALEAVLEGYGRPEVAAAVGPWRALVALDAGGWYLREGLDATAGPLLARGARLAARDPVEEAAARWAERYPGADGFRALTALVRGYAATVREVEAVLRPLGLSLSRFEVLLLLSFSRAGALPIMRIRDLLMVHGSSVTYLVDRLQEAGWVARDDDPGDRRVSLVRLTDAGRETVEAAAALLAEAGFGSLATLDEGERGRLADLLARLRPRA